ncbi:lipocalin family protein [Flavobacterium psychrotrophum]|uniref:lipocalin family protein n=1 Tax=Flavobacterium psychrotrophum TaxID=2294119 RepID=UPI000E319D0A|nr:lipocalin family protein [Flavobacterium psychrotrophum]
MKKAAFLFLFTTLLFSCKEQSSEKGYNAINGYWEIEKVIMPDGSEKDYSVNPTIDFFEIKDSVGSRKKVMPQMDGSYRMNDLSEKLTLSKKSGKTIMSYSTEYAKWQEELIELNEEELVVKNQHNIEYHYKKPEPFTVK